MLSLNQTKQQHQSFNAPTTHNLPPIDNQYISQFLVLKDQQQRQDFDDVQQIGSDESLVSFDEKKRDAKEEIRQKSSSDADEIYQESSSFEDSDQAESKPKRSPLHNFQKHFVTTIRRSVRLTWPENPSQILKLAKEIWQTFKNSHKYTKQFVSLILGQNSPSIDQNLLKKYNLLQKVSKYPVSTLPKAQRYLKQKVIETFRELPKQKIMYERRIQKKQEFASYFLKVLGELEHGAMNKRLPKRKRGGRRSSFTTSKNSETNHQNQENF